jgi:hypothetical protein
MRAGRWLTLAQREKSREEIPRSKTQPPGTLRSVPGGCARQCQKKKSQPAGPSPQANLLFLAFFRSLFLRRFLLGCHRLSSRIWMQRACARVGQRYAGTSDNAIELCGFEKKNSTAPCPPEFIAATLPKTRRDSGGQFGDAPGHGGVSSLQYHEPWIPGRNSGRRAVAFSDVERHRTQPSADCRSRGRDLSDTPGYPAGVGAVVLDAGGFPASPRRLPFRAAGRALRAQGRECCGRRCPARRRDFR